MKIYAFGVGGVFGLVADHVHAQVPLKVSCCTSSFFFFLKAGQLLVDTNASTHQP
jgi:hypothetical protein